MTDDPRPTLRRGLRSPSQPSDSSEFVDTSETPPRWLASSVSEPRVVDPDRALLATSDATSRYSTARELGAGAMGIVYLSKDGWIGRDVAMKVMRPAAGDARRERFLREVCIQGQLEHPGIVPVYDFGVSDDGLPHFTMKRVTGLSLGEIMSRIARGDQAIVRAFPQRRLLSALSQASAAVAFAHSRGVVHRDLKPDNIMLGEFGEVYVIDWGVARIRGREDASADTTESASAPAHATLMGTLVGTPGYAAPEQMRGDLAAIGPWTDVYAFGAILFELLVREPLHRGEHVQELIDSTLVPQAASPRRCPSGSNVAPELDALCQRACAFAPDQRFASARDLHAALEAFLDGERDLERRRQSAQTHVLAAQAALALTVGRGADAEHHRAHAMRELSAALAFDPGNPAALSALREALLHAPDELPPDAEAAMVAATRRDQRSAMKRGTLAFLGTLLPAPLLFAMGIRSWPLMAAMAFVLIGRLAHDLRLRRGGRVSQQWTLEFSFITLLSSFFGPLLIVPAAAAVLCAAIISGARATRKTRNSVLLLGVSSVAGPLLLELWGVLPPSFLFEDGVIKILPRAVDFSPAPTLAFLVIASLLPVVTSALLIGRNVESLIVAERRNFARAWRLRQVLPPM